MSQKGSGIVTVQLTPLVAVPIGTHFSAIVMVLRLHILRKKLDALPDMVFVGI